MTLLVRFAAAAVTVVVAVVLLVYVLRVEPSDLTWLVFTLTGFAWLSFVVLGYAAVQPPRIGALSERTVIALVIALLGSVSCLIILNTDAGRPLFDAATASLLFRLAILGVLCVPTGWLVLLVTRRLGTSGKG